MPSDASPEHGDGQFGAMQVGERATIKLVRHEEYYVDVLKHPDTNPERAAGEQVFSDTPSDEYMTVHAEVLKSEPIYEDDPEACDVSSWIDAPSAPSEQTFWDDSRHFEDVSHAE